MNIDALIRMTTTPLPRSLYAISLTGLNRTLKVWLIR
jgi:hypothetical protein